jgi:hypothetical protein
MILNFDTRLGADASITLPLYGTVDVDIDWGDESGLQHVGAAGGVVKTYASEGEYTVTITVTLTEFADQATDPNTHIANMAKLVSVTSFGDLGLTKINLKGCLNLTNVPNSIPTSITNIDRLFLACEIFNSPNVSSWDTSNINSMAQTFRRSYAFDQPLNSWDVSNVTAFLFMFQDASIFNQDLDGWEFDSAIIMAQMFARCSLFNGTFGDGVNLPEVTSMGSMFKTCTSFNQPINFKTPKLGSTSSMFEGATSFNNTVRLDTEKVTNATSMFEGATSFNQPVNLDLSSSTSSHTMFQGCVSFNSPVTIKLNSIDAGPMPAMFYGCTEYEGNDLNINMEGATKIHSFFRNCPKFNGPNIVDWDIGNCADNDAVFEHCVEFNQDISGWDTSSQDSAINMFYGATKFNQDLSSWDMTAMEDPLTLFFTNSGMSVENYSKTLIGWASQDLPSGIALGASAGYGTIAAAARDNLVNTQGWTISDGGLRYKLTYTCTTGTEMLGEQVQYVVPGSDGSEVTVVKANRSRFQGWGDGDASLSRLDANIQGDLSVKARFRFREKIGKVLSNPANICGGSLPRNTNRGSSKGNAVDNSEGYNISRDQSDIKNKTFNGYIAPNLR